MRYLSVCAGIEAASVAWHPLGWEPLAFSEIEPFPRAVLEHHYPDVPLHGDFTVLKDQPWIVDADILVGGTPCQAFSVAGLRNSLSDDRGNLTLGFVRLANAIDDLRRAAGRYPSIIVWENVPGVLSDKGNAFGCFLGALAGEDCELQPAGGRWSNAGCVFGPARAIAWRILDAQFFGVAQRRRRVFVVASARAGFNPAQVLFEFDGLRRDTPPRRGARTAVAALTANGVGTCGADDNQGQAGHLIPAEGCWWDGGQVSQTLDAVLAKGQTMPEKNRFPAVLQPVAHSSTGAGYWREGIGPLRAREQDSHENLVAFHPTQDPISSTDGSTHAIGCGSSGGQASVGVAYGIRTANTSSNGWGIQEEVTHTLDRAMGQAVAIGFAQNTRNEVRLVGGDGSISGALAAQPGMKQTTYVATCVTGEVTHTLKAEGFDGSEDGTGRGQPIVTHYQEGQYGIAEYPTSGTIRAGRIPEHEMVLNHTEMAVRRLTPRECERLQGFPDDWTLVPVRGKPAADGPRYKAIGNSMATPVMRWIGRRILSSLH